VNGLLKYMQSWMYVLQGDLRLLVCKEKNESSFLPKINCMCMDFIKNLPEPQRYDVILVMVDQFVKFAYMVPIVRTPTVLETT
jgi:hypothetical protein